MDYVKNIVLIMVTCYTSATVTKQRTANSDVALRT